MSDFLFAMDDLVEDEPELVYDLLDDVMEPPDPDDYEPPQHGPLCPPPRCCPFTRPATRSGRTTSWRRPVRTGPSVDDYRPPTHTQKD